MTKELTIIEIAETNVSELKFEDIGNLAFSIQNARTKLKELNAIVDVKEKEIEDFLKTNYNYSVDEKGVLQNTQILNPETGETIGLLEWVQGETANFDVEKAMELLKTADDTFFYRTTLKTQDDLKKMLKAGGLTPEQILLCFPKTKKNVELKLKKL